MTESISLRQEAVKLDILTSLAMSQRALARMLEAVADVSVADPQMAVQLQKNIESLCKHQEIVAAKLTGITIRRLKEGAPCEPWLNHEVRLRPAAGVE